MQWERPDFIEIGMNAEIGGYQSDFGGGEPAGPRDPVLSAALGAAPAVGSGKTEARTPPASV